jgi:CHRD domain
MCVLKPEPGLPMTFGAADGAGTASKLPVSLARASCLFSALTAGDMYINVHARDHPAGEIRGQVMPPKS